MSLIAIVAGLLTLRARIASAQTAPEGNGSGANLAATTEVSAAIPNVAYAYSAGGTVARTMGLQVYAQGLAAPERERVFGGGGAVWGSPIDRLTLILDGQRSVSRDFTPSAAAVVRMLGNGTRGFSLGALGKFKIDGFAAGPRHDEVESEIELGFLASVIESGWVLDLNAIAGRGLGDEGETDTEGRLRVARAVGSMLRLGIDGQARARISGPRNLPNGRSWDFAVGPQALLWINHFYGSMTTGPTTIGVTSTKIGWVAIASFGGTTF